MSSPGNHIAVISGCSPRPFAGITGLSNNQTYSFYVFGISEAGVSEASPASNEVTPFGTPSAPTDVAATPEDGSISVTWSAPSDGGSPITSYNIEVTPGAEIQSATGSPPPTTATMGNLANGTAYSVTVTAINAAGSSPASLPSNQAVPTGAITPPGQPTGVAAYSADKAATVVWSPPSDGGQPITSYTLTATPVTLSTSSSAVAPSGSPAQASTQPPPTSFHTATNTPVTPTTTTPSKSSTSFPSHSPCLLWLNSLCAIAFPDSTGSPPPTGDPASSWRLIHESSLQGSVVMDITCPSLSECIGVGAQNANTSESPAIWRTSNGGATWSHVIPAGASNVQAELLAVSCPSPTFCVALGANGIGDIGNSSVLYVTTDGGATWTSESLPGGIDSLSGLSCTSTSTCFASGNAEVTLNGVTEATPAVVETTDGGMTWQLISSGITSPGTLSRITCTSTTDCMAVGYIAAGITGTSVNLVAISLTTTNGGLTWTENQIAGSFISNNTATSPFLLTVTCTTGLDCIAGGASISISIGSPGTVATIGQVIYVTTDGGATWQVASLPTVSSGNPLSTKTMCDPLKMFSLHSFAYFPLKSAVVITTIISLSPSTS